MYSFESGICQTSVIIYKKNVGICLEDLIIVHLLWADDLLLVTDSILGMQKQLDGLKKFCALNHMILNAIKTKIMVFGKHKRDEVKVYFNGRIIDLVDAYKYLGNLITAIHIATGDIFSQQYPYLINKARGALFALKRKLHGLGDVPPRIFLFLFQHMIEPILLYGAEIWGTSNKGTRQIDTFYLSFIKSLLKVKPSTSNIITNGEVGCIPTGVKCHIRALCYYIRVKRMSNDCLLKKAFNQLVSLQEVGFPTWIGRIYKLASKYNIHLESMSKDKNYKSHCKLHVTNQYISNWFTSLNDIKTNPLLRTYVTWKDHFMFETYLEAVKKPKYRNAISRLRASSHNLMIEYGRHHALPLDQRICKTCSLLEDEKHLVISCHSHSIGRYVLFSKISNHYPCFMSLSDNDKFSFLFKSADPQVLTWLGKFIYNAMKDRDSRVDCNATESV